MTWIFLESHTLMRNTRVAINRSALLHNITIVKQHAPHSQIIAMLKANAYGHGAAQIADILVQANCIDAIGVALLEEALPLRKQHPNIPIIVFQGINQADELHITADNNIQLVLHTAKQINLLQQTTLTKPVQVWLKINTGMNRLGVSPKHAAHLWQQLHDCESVAKPIRCMSHFANANLLNDPKTEQQLACFNKTVDTFADDSSSIECSLAKSATILHVPNAHRDWVRPGLMMYGASPVASTTASDYHLQPVMTLHANIIAIQQCQAGDHVGYDGTWQCPQAMPVGIVNIGYGDGYPRHVPNGTPVLINGKRAGIVGRVSMDMLAVDLHELPDCEIGTPVVLWGNGLPIEEIATYANTTAYELLAQINSRVIRVIE